jgi:regulatory protein
MRDMEEKLYEKTLARAFRLLAARPRTVAELRERLREKAWAEDAVTDRVIKRLEELGYLNDEQYATSFATSKLTARPIGRTRLRRDLQRKKVSSQAAEQALDEIYAERSEEELIARAIAKRVRLKGRPQSPEETKKLFDHLLRLGFSFDLVRQKIKELGRADDIEEDAL